MEIRKMVLGDYDAVYELWMACAGMGLNNLDDSREGICRFIDRNPDTCFVAVDEDRVVGAIMAGNDGRRGYIYHTAVNEEYRKRGIGTRLVHSVLEALRRQQISKVALVVFGKNTAGNAFWEKRGFTERQDLVYRNRTLTEMIRIDT